MVVGGAQRFHMCICLRRGGGNGQSEGPGGTSPTHGTMGGEFTLKIHKYTSTLAKKIAPFTHFRVVVYCLLPVFLINSPWHKIGSFACKSILLYQPASVHDKLPVAHRVCKGRGKIFIF